MCHLEHKLTSKQTSMKQNVRRALAISGIAVVIGTTGIAHNADAKIETKIEKNSHSKEFSTRNNFTTNVAARKQETSKQRRTVLGTVTYISENYLKIKTRNKIYTVNISPNTRILDVGWQKMSPQNIKLNDKLRILGTISEKNISAQTIRDVSPSAEQIS